MDYNMIKAEDRLLVGVSGGADSTALLDLLNTSMLHVPNDFSLLAAHIDLGFDEGRGSVILESYLKEQGYNYIIDRTDIGPLSHSDFNKKNPCFLCARLRRKRLFEIADEHNCNKIVLAHHRDDLIETLLINLFYGREISTMVPNQVIFGGKMSIIRPLAYIREELVKKYAREQEFPIVTNGCPTSRTSKRNEIKELLNELEVRGNQKIRDNIFRAMYHVKPDYMPGAGKNSGFGVQSPKMIKEEVTSDK